MSDKIVKNLSFGDDAKVKVFEGINKLTKAVSSTLGASGQCVILEDGSGRPIITKDGVTVADSITLLDPVENMGATLLKEAARKNLERKSIEVSGDMLKDIATISCNNERDLGEIIGDAFEAVGENGVVMMEPTDVEETSFELVDGVQYEKGLTNSHFVTSQEKRVAELEKPVVLLLESPVETIRKIQSVLEHVIQNNIPLLIIE